MTTTHRSAQGPEDLGSVPGADAVSASIAPIGAAGPQDPAIPPAEREPVRTGEIVDPGGMQEDRRSAHAKPHRRRVEISERAQLILKAEETRQRLEKRAARRHFLETDIGAEATAWRVRREQRRREARRREYESRWHAVYKMYDGRDRLLYVGIAVDGPKRVESHERNKQWFRKVVRIELEHVKGREAALARELELIRTADPVWNVAGKDPENIRRHA